MKMDLSHAEELLGVPLETLAAAITLIEGQSYVELRAKGISCVSEDNATVTAVQLHSFGHERYSRYTGVLPCNLEFMMGRSQVRASLGTPQQSGEATAIPILGVKPAWDAFIIDRLRVHIEYTDTCDSIGMVTLTKHIK